MGERGAIGGFRSMSSPPARRLHHYGFFDHGMCPWAADSPLLSAAAANSGAWNSLDARPEDVFQGTEVTRRSSSGGPRARCAHRGRGPHSIRRAFRR